MAHLPTIIPASQARSNFYDLLDEVSTTAKRFIITRHGRAVAIILGYKEYESWIKIMEPRDKKNHYNAR